MSRAITTFSPTSPVTPCSTRGLAALRSYRAQGKIQPRVKHRATASLRRNADLGTMPIVTWRKGVSFASMPCRLCVWLCDRFCLPKSTFWSNSRQWEETYSQEWEPQEWEPWDETVERRTRAAEAARMVKSDPKAALALFIQLADEGSIFAMRWLGTLYHGRHGIVRNLKCAENYLRRGLSAGSWMSTLDYTNLLYKRGAHDKWHSTLADGVEKAFIPSFFWQAFNIYRLNPSRKVAEEVRPLMLKAAEAGHPGAEVMLAIWTARGKFGLRKIPEGFRTLWAVLSKIRVAPVPN